MLSDGVPELYNDALGREAIPNTNLSLKKKKNFLLSY